MRYSNSSNKAANEILHGRKLSRRDPEKEWGWGTPAGQRRALRRARIIAQKSAVKPDHKILEIGCGTGLFTEQFVATGADITAVDISPDLLKMAKERLYNRPVRLICGRFEDLGLNESFDALIGSSVLHHLNLDAALQKMLSLLAPGGTMCFAEPNYLNPQVFITLKLRRFFPEVSPDEKAFIRWQLTARMKKAGFENCRIVPVDWLHPATPARYIDRVEKIGKAIERLPFLSEFSGSLLISAKKPAPGK